jgi:quercetin dioxygenase-like cupin family protein
MTTTEPMTSEQPFTPIAEGVEMRVLRRHERGMTFLIRMRPGAVAPLHEHPGGEETFVLEGRLRIQKRVTAERAPEPDIVLSKGEYAFVPPGEVHAGLAEEGALFLVVAPGGIARAAATGSGDASDAAP